MVICFLTSAASEPVVNGSLFKVCTCYGGTTLNYKLKIRSDVRKRSTSSQNTIIFHS